MDLLLKAVIGEYRVTDFIGEGAMGRVYRAEHRRLGRQCAIKFLTAFSGDPGFLQSLIKRAQTQLRLRDAGIATLYEVTEYRDTPVMITEFVEGETLHDNVQREGPWPVGKAVTALLECARCLEHVHANGILHRDLKCTNVKRNAKGEIKLLDFGAAIPLTAKTLQQLSASPFATRSFRALAPEQTRGEEATPETDVWSFGVLAYQLLTGELPFEGEDIDALFRGIARAQYRPPRVLNPAIPQGMERVIQSCLQRDPAKRYRSAGALRQAIEAVQAGDGAADGGSRRHGFASHWKPIVWTCIGGLVLAAGVAGIEHLTAPTAPQPAAPASPGAADTTVATTRGDVNQLQRIVVQTPDGPAEVWRDGQRVGTTPYTADEPYGGAVELVLKRPGYLDKPVQIDVGDQTSYTFALQRQTAR